MALVLAYTSQCRNVCIHAIVGSLLDLFANNGPVPRQWTAVKCTGIMDFCLDIILELGMFAGPSETAPTSFTVSSQTLFGQTS